MNHPLRTPDGRIAGARLSARELLDHLRAEGFTVEREGRDLRVKPASGVSGDLAQLLRERKDDLLWELRHADPDGPCEECGSVTFYRYYGGEWECMGCNGFPHPSADEMYFGPTKWSEGAEWGPRGAAG